jgi:hypothetical protein
MLPPQKWPMDMIHKNIRISRLKCSTYRKNHPAGLDFSGNSLLFRMGMSSD